MGDKTLRRPGTAELNLIRGKLRFMARLFIKVQNCCRVNTVSEMLDCKHFDHLLCAAREMSMDNTQIGLTMGGFLKQLNIIKRSFAMKAKDSQMKEDCDDFLWHMKQKWTNYVAAIASKRQKLKTLNKPQELPLESRQRLGHSNKLFKK
ncbi:hypothetical protein EB796_020465 [Bugula neritina]|uniref:Uncharacterized protein n=1 Tax=Bugula neritina TaxID=10212 RepID=A0A7J7J6S3_BUGNE|nr:hypothetical protein EB796_020465 [Bugula neritina]